MRRWLGILLLLCGLPLSGEAAVAFGAATSGSTTASATSLTYAHTVSAGSNRFLEVGVTIDDQVVAVTGITFNGDALTLKCRAVHTTQFLSVEKWSLVNPDVATGNVVVTVSSAEGIVSGAVSMTGVDQANPYRGACVTADNDNSSSIVVVVPSAVDDLVTDAGGLSTAAAMTVGVSQTERWNTDATTDNTHRGYGSTEPGAASVTMGWTTGDLRSMILAGTSIQADGAAVTRGRRILIVQ